MDENAFVEKLIQKSEEAFLMAIEIYNKPSIKYRVEGFSFFICNAWELMLKALIIKRDGIEGIYYRDHPTRSLSLERCIQLVLTNEKDPLRKNLERIIALRNSSTHLIVEEYEMVYIPLFQACVFNYTEKMLAYHDVDISELVPRNFLTLTVRMDTVDEVELRAKYPDVISSHILRDFDAVSDTLDDASPNYAIRVEHRHYITKKRNEATEVLYVDRNAKEGISIVREIKDVNKVYGYSVKRSVEEIKRRLSRAGVQLCYNGDPVLFNKSHFSDLVKYFGIKDNDRFCYAYMVSSNPQYSYSSAAIDFLLEQIEKDPENILDVVRRSLKAKKVDTRGKGF